MASVYANSRSIAHKGDGGVNVAAIPDVCNTPIIVPVPIPYVNVAMTSDLADGSQDVKIEGNPAAKDSSNLSTSMGDEAGSIGGLVSGRFKGKLTWACGSSDVLIEGAGAVRFADVALHNGDSPNTVFIQAGAVGVIGDGGSDSPPEKCPLCEEPRSQHREAEPNKELDADMKSLIGELEGKEVYREGKPNPCTYYAVAIAACGCHFGGPRIVATSGTGLLADDATRDAFEAAVAAAGPKWLTVDDAPDNAVPPGWIRNFRGPIDDQPRGEAILAQLAMRSVMYKKYSDAANASAADREERKEVYNLPGNCAAPRAINRAHEKGWDVRYFAEYWFSPLDDGKGKTHPHAEPMAACKTCEILLLMMFCDDEEKPPCKNS